jgi:hypothetical protein
MKLQNFLLVCLLLPGCRLYKAQVKVIPYGELPTAAGAPTGSGMFFGASMSTNTVTFTFTGPADRWIALGYGVTQMAGADVLIYSQGQSFSPHPLGWNDYKNGSGSTANDTQQDWSIISSTVVGSARTVVATRTLNTGDANDFVISYTAAALDVIWAHAATGIYTITQHGVNDRAYGMHMIWQSQPTAAFATSVTTICEGQAITYSNTSSGGATTFTWNFPGGTPASFSGTAAVVTVTYATPGTYSAALSVSNTIGTSSVSLVNYLTVTPTVVPSASLTLSGGTNPMCAGTAAQFSVSSTNTGGTPFFQWKVNGVNAGSSAPSFSSASLGNNATVICFITANGVCAVPLTATTSAIVMTVNSTAPASASVSIVSGGNPICSGMNVTFTALPGNGGTSPSYQWKVNNVNVGANSSSYSSNVLQNGDVVTVDLISNAPCATSLNAVSIPVTMTVSAVLSPSVSLSVTTGSNPSCAGRLLSLSAIVANGGATPTFQWKLNGVNTGSNGPVFSSTTFTSGMTVSCILTSDLSCASPATATTVPLTLTVNPIPLVPQVVASGALIFCAGEQLTLTSSAATGNSWSNGATTQTIVVMASGNYSVTQIQNGCSSAPSQAIAVIVKPVPVVSMDSLHALCRDDKAVTLSGGTPSGGSYTGTGVNGSSFDPKISGAGTFTAGYFYLDTNFCSNSAVITVKVDECVKIVNGLVLNETIRIYPSPTHGIINIVADQKILNVVVYDLAGRKVGIVFEQKERSAGIDLSKEPDGIYVVDIRSAQEKIRTRISKMN